MNQATWLIKELEKLPTRKVDPIHVSPEQFKESEKFLPYWHDKTTHAIGTNFCPPELVRKVQGTGWAETGGYFHVGGSHFNPPWELILGKGLSWYEERVREQLAALDSANPEQLGKEHFYQALLLVVEAIKDFAVKYADKALELSRQEKDQRRREELSEIAEILNRVPYHGARSFREATLQCGYRQILCRAILCRANVANS